MLVVSLEFLVLAVVVALAGTFLAKSADQIAEITRLGRLLVGSVLLAAATSLPELTVDISAVRQGMPDLAVGDLFGSSLMNLLILASLDLAHRSGGKMLSRESAAHALSAILGIALTAIATMAILTEPRLPGFSFLGIGIWSWGILVAYILGIRMIFLDQRVSASTVVEAEEATESVAIDMVLAKVTADPLKISLLFATKLLERTYSTQAANHTHTEHLALRDL